MKKLLIKIKELLVSAMIAGLCSEEEFYEE